MHREVVRQIVSDVAESNDGSAVVFRLGIECRFEGIQDLCEDLSALVRYVYE